MSFIFDANETPQQRAMRQKAMNQSGYNPMNVPRNVGEGIAAIGQALAYRGLLADQQKAAADPWSGMRQTTASANPFAKMAGLFGLGASTMFGA